MWLHGAGSWLLRTDTVEEQHVPVATGPEGLVRGKKPPPQQGTYWDVLWRSKQFSTCPTVASIHCRQGISPAHTGPAPLSWGLAFLSAQLQHSGFGLSAAEEKHGCICKHLCLLPHYFWLAHINIHFMLSWWRICLAGLRLWLRLCSWLCTSQSVSDLPSIITPGLGRAHQHVAAGHRCCTQRRTILHGPGSPFPLLCPARQYRGTAKAMHGEGRGGTSGAEKIPSLHSSTSLAFLSCQHCMPASSRWLSCHLGSAQPSGCERVHVCPWVN